MELLGHWDPAAIEKALVIDSELAKEFSEFLAAKKRKREPLKWRAKGGASADYIPRDRHGFANFRKALRQAIDFSYASERLDAIETALLKRHNIGLPLPRKVIQKEDRSLTIFWKGFTVSCFVDGIAFLVGGIKGVPVKGITNDLLDMLAFQSKIEKG